MSPLPQDIAALGLLVFVLGLKHGFDADHLATIDGLTRFNSRAKPRMARYCGALFSLGHGAVVVAIALTVSLLSRRWDAPGWLDVVGAWVSIGVLAALGFLNIQAVLRTHPAEVVRLVGVKGRLLGRLTRASHPALVAAIGALFALSFDTVSQAALFALTAARLGGWQPALVMGLLFMLGMLVTDGINGLWISRLICRADRMAWVASRVMSLAVAGVSLLIAGLGVVKLVSPAVESWSDGKEIALGAAVVGTIVSGYFLAVWRARAGAVGVTPEG